MLEELNNFIRINNLSAEVFEVRGKADTAFKAAARIKYPEKAVKSILLIDSNKDAILVVLRGVDKIDFQKVKKVLEVKDVRMALQEEVFKITGYEVGGVPPISVYGVTIIVDKAVAERDDIVCGGGDTIHLMKLRVKEMLENIEEPIIEDVKK